MTKFINTICLISISILATVVHGEESNSIEVEEFLIIGTKADKQRLAGSGIQIDAELIEKHAYSDLNQVISLSPGVYVREEDGYGLAT
jgi:Fe(3+) dicitrate transport protein